MFSELGVRKERKILNLHIMYNITKAPINEDYD